MTPARPTPTQTAAVLREPEMLDRGLAILGEFGLQAKMLASDDGTRGPDAWLEIGRGNTKHGYALQLKRRPTNAVLGLLKQFRHTADVEVFLIADYVPPPLAERLREAGIAFVDLAGNAYIEKPEILIWQSGRRPPAATPEQRAVRTWQPAGLKVLFALLCDPHRVDQPVREIAAAAGVAHGTVGHILDDLIRMHHVSELGPRPGRGRGRRRVLEQPAALLDLWVEAYARVLRPKQDPRRYRTLDAHDDLNWWRNAELDDAAQFGGEPAAAVLTRHLKPGEVTVYVRGDARPLLKRHCLVPDNNGRTLLLDRFWRFDYDWNYKNLTPPILIYADLLATANDRCIEAARMVHERHIARHLQAH